MRLLEIYKQQILSLNYEYDEMQVEVLSAFQELSDILNQKYNIKAKRIKHNFFNKVKNNIYNVFNKIKHKNNIISGVYLWGGVGLGKTFLVDLFFNNLPIKQKKRIHFHQFMYEFHQGLKLLENIVDPVDHYIEKFSKSFKILVLDEFIVEDIADAMILYNILKPFVKYKIVLVTTSNTKPDNLYLNGLQREYFLDAITLIKNYNKTIFLESENDYRRSFLSSHSLYNYIAKDSSKILGKYFSKLAGHNADIEKSIIINDRKVSIIAKSPKVLWVNFSSICDTNRSSDDYLEIARLYKTILISDIPVLIDENLSAAKRFINLIDVLYDNNISIIVSSYSKSIDDIYNDKSLAKSFLRTKSRIIEMTNKHIFKI